MTSAHKTGARAGASRSAHLILTPPPSRTHPASGPLLNIPAAFVPARRPARYGKHIDIVNVQQTAHPPSVQFVLQFAIPISNCRMKELRDPAILDKNGLPSGDCGNPKCRFSVLNPLNNGDDGLSDIFSSGSEIPDCPPSPEKGNKSV
ncbi:hypothetical protein NM688_g2429 [Phlebia brevispora]|uniref:Uncharacterized protein n=1 Tax=Phlebia brevispora TaxID=194682 RepID=A0ACC1T8Q7_9APHY|nr:hypothetical protein NM688_g2429 [Phlebia brevispora]